MSEPDNAAAQTGAGTSFGANGDQHTRAAELSTYFCVLTIRKQLSEMRFERSGGEQEPSRGHKFSILENVVLHWDFTSAMRLHFRSDLVGVALVGATPLHLLSQTALPLKSPTGAFLAPLRFANAVPPQTLLRLFTANWKLSVIKYQQQIPLSNDSPVRVCLYWNCVLLLRSTSKEFSYCDAMLCCTVYTNQRDLVCRISATPDT